MLYEVVSQSDIMDKLTNGYNTEVALGTPPFGVRWATDSSPDPNEGIVPTIGGQAAERVLNPGPDVHVDISSEKRLVGGNCIAKQTIDNKSHHHSQTALSKSGRSLLA